MRICQRVFHDEQIKDRKRVGILKKLAKNQKVSNVKLILRMGDDKNLMHIVSPREKDGLLARKRPIVLIGIAKNTKGAQDVVQEVIEGVLAEHGAISGELIDKELDIDWK